MVAPLGLWQNDLRKSKTGTSQGCYMVFWTNSRSSPYKTATVWPHTNHLSKINKTCRALLEKKGKTGVLLLTPTHRYTNVSQPAKTYILHFCINTGCCQENLLRAMAERDRWYKSQMCCQLTLMICNVFEWLRENWNWKIYKWINQKKQSPNSQAEAFIVWQAVMGEWLW